MSAEAQNRLFGDLGGEPVEIETSGRVIRPAINYVSTVVDEAKLRFDADGLHVRAVDPANVHALRLDVHPEAFDAYEFGGERLIGADVSKLARSLSNARKRNDDPVTLTIGDATIRVTTEREYDETTVEMHDEILTLDPDSVRETPEFPDLDTPNGAEIQPRAWSDAIEHLSNEFKAIKITGHGDDLELIAEDTDGTGSAATTFRDAAEISEPDAVSVLSTDYLTDAAEAVRKGYADDVRIKWGDELPYRLQFTRYADDDGETVAIDGEFLQAPRVSGGDDA